MSINILYIIDSVSFGGGERAFAQIINGLDKQKFNLYVACFPEGLFVEKIKGSVKLFPLDVRNRFNFFNIFYLKRVMRRNNIQIVHTQGTRTDFFGRIAAWAAGVPVVVSTVTTPVEGFDVNLLKKFIYIILDRFSERFVDEIVVVSDALIERLKKIHKFPSEAITRIYNGIEAEVYDPAKAHGSFRKELGLEDDLILVGGIGRLVYVKGFSYFIEAAKILERKALLSSQKVKYLIVGEGKLRPELETLVRRLGLEDKIIFTGFREDIKDVLSALDVFVLPSIQEGQPIILLEAMAMKKAIVATEIPGVLETIEKGKTGILVASQDASALAGAISLLLQDKTLAKSLSNAARISLESRFNIKEKIIQHQELYERLIAKSLRSK